MMSTRHLVTLGFLMELCYGLLYAVDSLESTLMFFIAINAATYLILAWAVWRCNAQEPEISRNTMLAIVFGFGMLFRFTLVPHFPVASDDIYRYLWDGQSGNTRDQPLHLPSARIRTWRHWQPPIFRQR